MPELPELQPSPTFVPLQNNNSLLRLQKQVRAAVDELDRLRQENAELHQRIQELTTPSPENAPVADATSDEQEVAATVERFEKILDGYLESEEDKDA